MKRERRKRWAGVEMEEMMEWWKMEEMLMEVEERMGRERMGNMWMEMKEVLCDDRMKMERVAVKISTRMMEIILFLIWRSGDLQWRHK